MPLRTTPAANVTGTIVIGYDGREVSLDALALARLLAETTGARLLVAAVFPYEVRHMGLDAYRHALDEDRRRVLVPVLDQLGGPDEADAEALGDHSAPRAPSSARKCVQRPDAFRTVSRAGGAASGV